MPAGASDPLHPDGLGSFRQGLRVQTCEASPSLGTVPPTATITSTSTIATSGSSTSTTSTTSTTSACSSSPPTTSCQAYTSTITRTLTATFTQTATQTQTQTQTVTVSGTACTPTGPGNNKVCTGGTGPGNYVGLCFFCCQYGYCPPGPCTCTKYGTPVPIPPSTGARGIPLKDEDDSYLGLCSFACDHGYCPPTACTTA